MIEIDEKDLPITVAQKLITATTDIPDDAIFVKTLNKICGGDGTQNAFNDDELMEIAEYLICFCHHQTQKKEIRNENNRGDAPGEVDALGSST